MMKFLSPNASRKAKMTLIFCGVILVIAAQAGGMTLYMNFLQEKVATVEVVRTKREIPPRTIIHEDDLEIVSVRVEDSVKGYLSSTEDIVGKEVTEPLAEREQITPQKYDRATKLPGQITMEIPTTWILSFPQSLRSWDKIALWEVLDPTKINASQSSSSANAITSTSPDINVDTGQVEGSSPPIVNEADLGVGSSEPFLKDVTVAFFKDSTSNDVRDVNEETPRMSAGSVGTKIEVNVTPEEFGKMREKANQGYKFIIGYY